ncbi:hypothetical protein [Roseibium suaedae]|uniref:SPOR domain-containing protein n=1 Tax=Roseibium suaedae TaxID=735517 RepID=A0A1M7KVG0_9HYPH|nr:hypothetical protein [Roseibium suaedae]SHM69362.1 hypothetical protein SAMN05444272_2986 [Roseibium suaedae]
MPKGPAKRKTRDLVTQALTTQRVFVSCWALGAILSGSLGLAAYHFGSGHLDFNTYAGVRLPPAGNVSTTASIGRTEIQVYPSQRNQLPQSTAHINALQTELATLRMRLTTLAQQNELYSARLAKLEQTAALPAPAGLASGAGKDAADKKPENTKAATADMAPPGKPKSEPARAIPKPAPQTPPSPVPMRMIETMPAPELSGAFSKRGNPECMSPVSDATGQDHTPTAKPDLVRFANAGALLPPIDGDPVETGSIPEKASPEPESKPSLVVPGQASGRISGSDGTALKRTDFAVVVGHYKTEAGARTAWQNFEHQNADRMRGMQAKVIASDLNPGELDLLLGPFANAADAAVACLKLLDISGTCRPAFFAGSDLPEDQVRLEANSRY